MTPEAQFKFHEGDEVRAIGPDFDLREGQLYVVEFAYDDAVEQVGEPVYSLSQPDRGAGGMEGRESHLKLVRTYAQMRARKLPTPLDIIKAVPIGWDWRGPFEITESDIAGETDAIELYGKTDEGLPFAVRLKVEWIEQVDL
jgi:hypothetical protein